MVCQGKINVVASEQQVVANGDPFDLRKGGPRIERDVSKRRRSDFEKAEVGCAAPDVDDEYMMGAVFEQLSRKLFRSFVLFEPAIKCCLRFLQKTDRFRKAGLGCGVQSESLCGCIEGRRHRECYLLLIKTDSLASKPRIPGDAQVFKKEGGRSNG